MPSTFSSEVKDLINKLLVKDPQKRLGLRGVEEIKAHSFFKVCIDVFNIEGFQTKKFLSCSLI